MKHFIILITIAITIAAFVQPLTARDAWDTERIIEVIRSWGNEYNASMVQPFSARDTRETERTKEIIRNWGGEFD